MSTRVHSSLKIIAFSANGIGSQAYEVRKQLQDLKIDVALFSETHLNPLHTDIYRTDREDGHKGGTDVAVMKGIPHTCIDLPPVLSGETIGVCIPIGNTEMFLAALYKSPQRLWSDTDTTGLLGFRNKSILAGDLNARHTVWSRKFSNPSGLNFLELFISYNFEISAPQCSTHYIPDGTGDVLDIVVHQNVRLSALIVTDILNSDHLPIMLLERGKL
jgi:hypothetical protein